MTEVPSTKVTSLQTRLYDEALVEICSCWLAFDLLRAGRICCLFGLAGIELARLLLSRVAVSGAQELWRRLR